MKTRILLLLLALTASAAQAQQRLTGRVVGPDQTPLAACTLQLRTHGIQQALRTTATAADGSFAFDSVAAGRYHLHMQAEAYASMTTEIVVQPGSSAQQLPAFVLQPDAAQNHSTQTVEILADRFYYGIAHLPHATAFGIYAGKRNEVVLLGRTNANLAINSQRQVFAKVPGIQVWENDGSGQQINVAARGLSPNRSWEFNTRQNGHDIASDPFGYPEAYYNPPLEAVERIEVVRGAASLQYGPQFGGLLNYVLHQGPTDKAFALRSTQTLGSYGLFNTYNQIGGQLGQLRYTALGHYRRADGWRNNSRYGSFTGYASMQYRLATNTSLRAEYTQLIYSAQQPGGLATQQFLDDAQQSTRARNWLAITWRMPALTLQTQLTDSIRLEWKSVALFGDRQSIGNTSAINSPDNGGARTLDADRYTTFSSELRLASGFVLAGRAHQAVMGLRFFSGNTLRQRATGTTGDGADFSFDATQVLARDLNFSTRNLAAFAEATFHVGSRVSLTPGVRFEHIRNTGQGTVAGTLLASRSQTRSLVLAGLGANVLISRNTTRDFVTELYANFTQGYRPVLFSDLFPTAANQRTDDNLQDAQGWNADLGYRGRLDGWLHYDVGVYWLHYGNRTGVLPVNEGVVTQLLTNIGTSRSIGYEGFVELDPLRALHIHTGKSRISFYNSTGFVEATYVRSYLATIAEGNRVEHAPKWNIRSGATYRYDGLVHQFSLTLSHVYTDAAYADAANTLDPNAGATAGLVPAYRVWDLAFRYDIKLQQTISVRGGVNNLADARYFTRRAGGYPGPGILPAEGRLFFVSLGVAL